MREFKVCQKQDDLKEQIIFLANDLKRRAKELSIDWDKSLESIDIKSTIQPNEILEWEITKNYIAYKEKED